MDNKETLINHIEDIPETVKLSQIINESLEKTIINDHSQILSSTVKGIFKRSEYFTTEKDFNTIGYKILRKNQLVFSPQNLWMGNINLNKKFEIGFVSPSYKIYNINENKINSLYLGYLVKSNKMIKKYKLISEQGASIVRRNLDIESFLNIEITVPSLSEQQKIASFLSLIDEKIEKQELKLILLNKYKRGLISLTFSNKNCCKEFKLKELLQPYTSKNTSLYEPVAVGKYGIRKRSEIYSKILSKDISKNKVIEKNTFVIGMGSKQIDFGILYEDIKYSVSPAYLTFKISKKINPKYLEEYLRNILPILSFKFMIIGARQGKNIDKEGFLNYSIYVPSIDRQNRISDTLIALDKKIEKENELLLLLKQYKQGLLQQMFI